MKKVVLLITIAVALAAAGCSRDAQANAFMKDYAQTCDAIVSKLKQEDLEGARETLDDAKPKLVAKWDKIRTGLPFQFSDGVKKRMKSDPEEKVGEVVEAANEYVKKNPRDEEKAKALALELANVFR